MTGRLFLRLMLLLPIILLFTACGDDEEKVVQEQKEKAYDVGIENLQKETDAYCVAQATKPNAKAVMKAQQPDGQPAHKGILAWGVGTYSDGTFHVHVFDRGQYSFILPQGNTQVQGTEGNDNIIAVPGAARIEGCSLEQLSELVLKYQPDVKKFQKVESLEQ